MKKIICFALTMVASLSVTTTSAQISISNLLGSSSIEEAVSEVVSAVTGGNTITTANITGTWNYESVAVELTSDNALMTAASTLATSQIEEKLESICSTVGIAKDLFSYTFNSDLSFTCVIKSKTLSGTYTLDEEAGTITMKYTTSIGGVSLGSMTAQCTLSSSSLALMFQADKLLTFITKVGSLTNNSTITTISELASSYEGANLGFNLTKQ